MATKYNFWTTDAGAITLPITPAGIDNFPIGQTTAAAGAFTTLSAATSLTLGTGTKTATATGDPAGTATLSKKSGIVASPALTTAAAATWTLTLTNTQIAATSIVLASLKYGGAGAPVITKITPGAGSVVIEVTNLHASAALNAALSIMFAVLEG